jgi:hypothetical protein
MKRSGQVVRAGGARRDPAPMPPNTALEPTACGARIAGILRGFGRAGRQLSARPLDANVVLYPKEYARKAT